MNRYYYDLHIHSCLSPCGDHDMTPNNIAGMAALKGLHIVALTDHNSVDNCRAFYAAAKRQGLIPVAGIEVTTAEEVHIVCLFPTLEVAEEFGDVFRNYRILYKNNKTLFGEQLILDENDERIGEEEYLLLNATSLSIDDTYTLAMSYGAAVFPAHIDREENGIINTLGCVPEHPAFRCVEVHDRSNQAVYREKYALEGKLFLANSDAHYLWDINEAENDIMLEDEPYSSDRVRAALLARLRGQD